jgi:site-specific recombinase XerD
MIYPKMEIHGGKFSMRFQRHGWPVKRFSARTEQKVLAKWAAELARYARARAEPRARTGTVAELVQLFIAEKIDTRESSPQTRNRESNRLEHFAHTCGFGAKFVKSVADDDIEDWMEKRSRSVSASTAAKDLIAVRHLFKWCITTKSARTRFGLDRRHLNPAAGLATPKFDDSRSRVMRSDEWERLKPACYAYDWTFGSMIEWAHESGCRRSELVKLTVGDIRERTFTLSMTKNGKPQERAMTKSARIWISQYLAGYAVTMDRPLKPDDKLFAFAWTLDALTQAFKRCRVKVGIIDLRLHDLRHNSESRIIPRCVPMVV